MRRLGVAVGWLLGLVAAGLVGFGIAASLNPKPAAVVIRRRFDRNGTERYAATAPYVPWTVVSELDIPYRPGDRDARLDVHRSTTPGPALPTIVWVHGGAWLSGSKDLIANYLRVVAGGGSTVVGIGYSIAPRATYPTPALQVLDALGYLTEHADELGDRPEPPGARGRLGRCADRRAGGRHDQQPRLRRVDRRPSDDLREPGRSAPCCSAGRSTCRWPAGCTGGTGGSSTP